METYQDGTQNNLQCHRKTAESPKLIEVDFSDWLFFFPECGLKVLKYLEEFKKKTKKIIAYF